MRWMKQWVNPMSMLMVAVFAITGCNTATEDTADVVGAGTDGEVKEVTIAVSEYPSWSTFLVMHQEGLIDKEAGKLGSVEKKWGVDVTVKVADYVDCFTLYSQGNAQAICITNMDILPIALTRKSVAIAPTSTSAGADACIVTGDVNEIADLKGKPVRGAELSVSHYLHVRAVQNAGLDPDEFPFKQMDPGTAAQAVQTNQDGVEAINVWNPYKLSTLRGRKGSKVLYDSTEIPREIIDMIVMDSEFLESDGGEEAAACLVDAFYQLNQKLGPALQTDGQPVVADKLSEESQSAAVALGSEFSNLGIDDMLIVLRETQFFADADAGLGLYNDKDFQTTITPRVAKVCNEILETTEKNPTIGFDDPSAQLNYTTTVMERVKSGR